MGEFFGSMYTFLFEDFFGMDLANYLWGLSSPYQDSNLYIGVGIWMLVTSLLVPILYYIVIDHPKLAKWWGWLIFWGINAVINLIVGWQWCLTELYAGKMKAIVPSTDQEVNLNISGADCWCFGVSNMFLSIFFFFILMFIVKWKSINCSHTPF